MPMRSYTSFKTRDDSLRDLYMLSEGRFTVTINQNNVIL